MITASLVVYHTAHSDLHRIIDTVKTSIIDKLYIIDNSSNDILKLYIDTNNTKCVYVKSDNVGYGKGHNIALNIAIQNNADYHIVLNPDIEFSPEVINELVEYMDRNDNVGLVMPKVIYPNGDLQYLCKLLPTPFDLIIRRFFPSTFFKKYRDRFELRNFGYDNEMNVPYLSGCFMFLRISSLKEVGLFDKRYFMYGEDIDLSRRIHEKYKTVFYPYVTIVHAHEKASYKNKKMLFIHIKNLIKYFNKWGWIFDKDRKRINKQTLSQFKFTN